MLYGCTKIMTSYLNKRKGAAIYTIPGLGMSPRRQLLKIRGDAAFPSYNNRLVVMDMTEWRSKYSVLVWEDEETSLGNGCTVGRNSPRSPQALGLSFRANKSSREVPPR